MNEDHVVAAILTAGLIARNSGGEIQPKDVVRMYEATLAELLAVLRPPRPGGAQG